MELIGSHTSQMKRQQVTRNRSRRRHQSGFTLVEILVVITIIGLIMSLVGPRVLNYLSESKVKAAKIELHERSRIVLPRRRAISQGRQRAQRSLGQGLHLPLARGPRAF